MATSYPGSVFSSQLVSKPLSGVMARAKVLATGVCIAWPAYGKSLDVAGGTLEVKRRSHTLCVNIAKLGESQQRCPSWNQESYAGKQAPCINLLWGRQTVSRGSREDHTGLRIGETLPYPSGLEAEMITTVRKTVPLHPPAAVTGVIYMAPNRAPSSALVLPECCSAQMRSYTNISDWPEDCSSELLRTCALALPAIQLALTSPTGHQHRAACRNRNRSTHASCQLRLD